MKYMYMVEMYSKRYPDMLVITYSNLKKRPTVSFISDLVNLEPVRIGKIVVSKVRIGNAITSRY